MPNGKRMANLTSHMLPSGDGEKMKINHPTNNPRPSFRQTRKNNSISNPPFTWKENLSLISFGWAQGTRTSLGATPQHPIQLQGLWEQKGNCSHMPPGTSMANITAHVLPSGDGEKMKIRHPKITQGHPSGKPRKMTQSPTHLSHEKKTYHWYHLDGHEGLGRAREPHHNNPYNSKDMERKRLIVHICLPGWAWPTLPLMCYWVGMEKDENWAPYKWPKAIVQVNPKTPQLPTHLSHGKKTFHWYHLEGHEGTRTILGATPQQSIQIQEPGEQKGNCYICLLGWAWPTLPLMCYQVGMERRWKSATLQMTQGHPSGKPKKTTQLPTHVSHGKKTTH